MNDDSTPGDVDQPEEGMGLRFFLLVALSVAVVAAVVAAVVLVG